MNIKRSWLILVAKTNTKQKNNNCPFCRGCCSKEPFAIPDYWSWRERSEEEDEALYHEWMEEEYWRHREVIEDRE